MQEPSSALNGDMNPLTTTLKALAIMILAAFGSGALFDGIKTEWNPGPSVGFGVFLLLGAFFLYRAWFARS